MSLSILRKGYPDGLLGKESACNAGDTGDAGSIPGSGRSPGERNGNPLNILAWEISWTEEPGPWSCKELDNNEHEHNTF